MAPSLAASLIEAGAWGTIVADIRQAAVMLRAGLRRLILANKVGGRGGARRLAALRRAWPDAELHVFVDSTAAVDALSQAWVGDIVAFGVSHPCTCLHLHRVVFGIDERCQFVAAHPTFFG